ncbi:HD domain-containing phosphohydrolase [Acetobacterium carbinolicum]|uniref:HD domain-containing phosphohydrolase n=1 Tax=Acetobacterium carbinolicum TaxID=52690 RepID=UPI003BF60C89
MSAELIKDLLFNTALLLSISIVYNLFFIHFDERRKKWLEVALGVFLGGVGILLMMNTVSFSNGIIFDTRSILISVTGLFLGYLPTIMATLMISLYRIYLGGGGALTGVLVTVTSALIGLCWYRYRLKKIRQKPKKVWPELYLFGVIVHLAMLACMLALPNQQGFDVLQVITLPVLIIYPLGTLLLCLVMLQALKNREAEKNLRESRESYKYLYYEYQKKESLLRSLLDSLPDLVFYKDKAGVYLGCNKAFEGFAGKTKDELVGLTDFDLFDEKMATLFRDMDQLMMKEKKSRRNEEFVTYPDGQEVILETLKTPYYDHNAQILGLIGVSRDITERKKTEAEMLFLSQHDALTGLHNRGYYEKERQRLDDLDYLPLSLIIGDINGLKLINDAFGHGAGDKLLISIARILVSCAREKDVLVRTGGDEFVMLLPQTSYRETGALVEKIKKACKAGYELDNERIITSISLGFATKTREQEPFEKVFRLAEESMYRKKLLDYKSFHSTVLNSIKTTLFEKSNETEEHAERMAGMAKQLGQVLGLDQEELVALELATTLHDIGKISIDSKLLQKNGQLTDDEWLEVRKHPEVGYRIAQTVPELRKISEYILCHHERWDGTGYPQGLKTDEIPLLARILAIVDAYDAMTRDRPYRKAMTKKNAIDELKRNAGTQFDPVLVGVFIKDVIEENMIE